MSNDPTIKIESLKQALGRGEIDLDTFISAVTRESAFSTGGETTAQLPGALAVGARGVGIGGDNYGTINTGMFINVQGDEIERLLKLARVTTAATLLAPPLDAERKQVVAQYYSDIAQTLDDCAAVLKQRQVPHGKCGELLGYAHNLPDAIGDVIGVEQANIFKERLIQNHEIEWFGAKYFNMAQTAMDAKFGELEAAAGYFRAAAKSLKVKR